MAERRRVISQAEAEQAIQVNKFTPNGVTFVTDRNVGQLREEYKRTGTVFAGPKDPAHWVDESSYAGKPTPFIEDNGL